LPARLADDAGCRTGKGKYWPGYVNMFRGTSQRYHKHSARSGSCHIPNTLVHA
jgi:hypothetical protein